MNTSIFSTDATTAKQVDALIAAGLEHMNADGTIQWKDLADPVRPFNVAGGGLPIGYSRAWLIVRRAYLEANQPKALVTLPAPSEAMVTAATEFLKEHGGTTSPKALATNRAWAKVVQPMRETDALSWGEIAVRCGKPESKVRACFKATNAKKDLGLRIGKGGRFAYDEPEFYLAHRQAEGAYIPGDLASKPKVEQLLNAKGTDGKIVRAKRAVSKKQAAKAS